ncbi:MAG: HAD family phosphatase [Calditrichia bacterium]
MIRHIIFDLGNVLVRIHPQKTMQEFAERCNISMSDIRKFYLSDLHLGFMEGKYSPDDFFRQMMTMFPCDITRNEYIKIWEKVIGAPKEGIRGIVGALKDRYVLSVCSNTDPWHWQFVLREYDFIRDFQHYFLSYELKMNKPDPRVFGRILKHLNASGSECVFFDDTEENIQAADRFGIRSFLVSEPAEINEALQNLKLI